MTGRLPAELIANIKHYANAVDTWILDRTVAIYALADGGAAVLHGTGVLLQVADARFLVSAAHVLNERERALLVNVVRRGRPLINLGGHEVSISDERDIVDFGLARLSDEAANRIAEDKRFVRLDEIDTGRTPKPGAYRVVGYPGELARSRTDGVMQFVAPNAWCFGTELHDEELTNFKDGVSIAVSCPPDVTNDDGEPSRPPGLQCISGCGMWRVTLDRGGLAVQLAGIEHTWAIRKAIKGVLAHHVIDGIRRLHPDLAPAIDLTRRLDWPRRCR